MKPRLQVLLSWLLIAATLTVNALANILPINGLNTGQVSALYPNLFVPDGRTFAIWSVIYAWLLAYVVYDTLLAWQPANKPEASALAGRLRSWFWLTCLLNMGWIVAWHYLQTGLSLLIMLMLLGALTALFLAGMAARPGLSRTAHGLLVLPFVLYFAWICVATIANTTAWLVHLQWQGGPLDAATWSMVMIGVAALLAVFMVWRYGQPAFALVVAWALWGIWRGQPDPVHTAALAGLVLALGAAGFRLTMPLRRPQP